MIRDRNLTTSSRDYEHLTQLADSPAVPTAANCARA
jgi:hypothetical protein